MSPAPETVLVHVSGSDGPPSLEEAARQLRVSVEDLDGAFGVVPIDERQRLYCVKVRADRLPDDLDEDRGPFADPEIAPFGPVDSGPKRRE